MYDYFRQMSIFLEVVKAGSFRKAAQELNITPSAVTHHVKKLEKELGNKLYKHGTGRFELTQSGKDTVESFSDLMTLLDQKFQLSKARSEVSRQTIRFSFASAVGTDRFYKFISDYARENPNVSFDLNEIDRREDIDESDKHMSIRVGWPDTQPSGKAINIKPVTSHLVCSKSFAEENRIEKFKDLEHCRWIYMRGLPHPIRFGYNDNYVELNPHDIFYINSSNVAYQMVYNSVGVSTLLDFVLSADNAWDKVVPLFPDYKLPDRHLFISVRSDMWTNREVTRFCEAVKRHFLETDL